jgi:hypothetical protein
MGNGIRGLLERKRKEKFQISRNDVRTPSKMKMLYDIGEYESILER